VTRLHAVKKWNGRGQNAIGIWYNKVKFFQRNLHAIK
jgi:hypothetical protein